MNWDYGSFFGVYPMLLLGLTPVINLHIVRQFLANMCMPSSRLPNSGPRIEPKRPTPSAQPVPVARTWAG
ncbi:hypothetical protein APA49_30645 [Pseudomonas aeruginosa]|nr:hypothetical protein APA49_30645 [Pseudomonas aeruginosa]